MGTIFFLTFFRMSGFLMGLPGRRNRTGIQWRLVISLICALILTPGLGAALVVPNGSSARDLLESVLDFSQTAIPDLSAVLVWLRAGQEFVLGLSMGLSISIVLSAIVFFGKLVSNASGLASAEILDPATNEQTTPTATFLRLIALTAFIGAGGDRLLLTAVLDSYQTVPITAEVPIPAADVEPGNGSIGGAGPTIELLPEEQIRPLFRPLTVLVQNSFILGFRLAIPALISLLIALLAVALMSRSAPLINQFTVGMATNTLLFWGTFLLGLGVLTAVFNQDFEKSLDWTRSWPQ